MRSTLATTIDHTPSPLQWLRSLWNAAKRILRAATESAGGLSAEDEEWKLIQRVAGGGEQAKPAYRTLVERHQDWLVYFLTCMMGSRSDAEDIAQEVFVRAYLSIDRFRGDSRFKTWIRRIAINQAHNFRRSRKHDMLTEDDEPLTISIEDSSFGAIEARQALRRALRDLDFDERQLILLRYVELLPVNEIAETLDIGLSAAKMRLKRARDAFQHSYRSYTQAS